jgi:hypothetical protein
VSLAVHRSLGVSRGVDGAWAVDELPAGSSVRTAAQAGWVYVFIRCSDRIAYLFSKAVGRRFVVRAEQYGCKVYCRMESFPELCEFWQSAWDQA